MATQHTHDSMSATELGLGLVLDGDFMDDSVFMEQLLHETQSYGYISNPYSTTNWSLPYNSMAYETFLQNDMSPSASLVDYHNCMSPNDVTTETPEESPPLCALNQPPPWHCSGPSVTYDLKPIINQFPEPPTSASPANTPAPEQPPRLRSTTRNRRSKHRNPKATSNTPSDEDGIHSRPAPSRAEKNYRRRLNSSFEKLLEVMNLVIPKDSLSLHDQDIGKDLSKGDILHLASLRLIAMEKENRMLWERLEQMRVEAQRAVSWSGVAPVDY